MLRSHERLTARVTLKSLASWYESCKSQSEAGGAAHRWDTIARERRGLHWSRGRARARTRDRLRTGPPTAAISPSPEAATWGGKEEPPSWEWGGGGRRCGARPHRAGAVPITWVRRRPRPGSGGGSGGGARAQPLHLAPSSGLRVARTTGLAAAPLPWWARRKALGPGAARSASEARPGRYGPRAGSGGAAGRCGAARAWRTVCVCVYACGLGWRCCVCVCVCMREEQRCVGALPRACSAGCGRGCVRAAHTCAVRRARRAAAGRAHKHAWRWIDAYAQVDL